MESLLKCFSRAQKSYSSTETAFDSYIAKTQLAIETNTTNSFLIQKFFSVLAELEIFKDSDQKHLKAEEDVLYLDKFEGDDKATTVQENYEEIIQNLKIFFKKIPKIFRAENVQVLELKEEFIKDMFCNIKNLSTSNENLFIYFLERFSVFLLCQDVLKNRKRFFGYGEKFLWTDEYIFKEYMGAIMNKGLKHIKDLVFQKVNDSFLFSIMEISYKIEKVE